MCDYSLGMRIGLDIRALQTRDGSGGRGIGRYVSDLLEGLLTYGPEHKVVLFTIEGRKPPHDWGRRCEVVPVDGLIFQEMALPWFMKLPKFRSNQKLLGRYHAEAVASQRAAFERAVNGAKLDLLHLPTSVDVGSYPEGDFNAPVVMTFLDAIPLIDRTYLYDAWASFLQRHYDRQIANLKTAAAVVAISDASRADAFRFGKLPPERTRTIYPSIPPAFGIPIDAKPTLEKYGIKDPYLLFCSVPDAHKNPLRVIEAFAQAKERLGPRKLVFVSPRGEPYEPRVLNAAKSNGLAEGDVIVTGRVSDEELVAIFQASECLVSPSLIERFGLPAAQALAAGTPPIVSSRGSQPEVVGDAGIVVDPEDVPAIAQAMIKMTNDHVYREQLVARGREQAKRFVPERQARELLSLYEEVIRAPKTS